MVQPPRPKYDILDWPAAGPLPKAIAEEYTVALSNYFQHYSQEKAVGCALEALRLLISVWEIHLPKDVSPLVANAYPDAVHALEADYSADISREIRQIETLPAGTVGRNIGSILFYFSLGRLWRAAWAAHLSLTIQRTGDVFMRLGYGEQFYEDWATSCEHMTWTPLFE